MQLERPLHVVLEVKAASPSHLLTTPRWLPVVMAMRHVRMLTSSSQCMFASCFCVSRLFIRKSRTTQLQSPTPLVAAPAPLIEQCRHLQKGRSEVQHLVRMVLKIPLLPRLDRRQAE
jgi:hypothetical protein